jgi:anti-sigma regulatory factor (Ser/Thr protein kinase)
MAAILVGCPVAGDTILCLSELAANAVIHSASGQPGGAFIVRADVLDGAYVRIEVHDNGGPWSRPVHRDDRPHGLDIVGSLATESGVRGGALTGWISWVRLDWPRVLPSAGP